MGGHGNLRLRFVGEGWMGFARPVRSILVFPYRPFANLNDGVALFVPYIDCFQKPIGSQDVIP